MSQPQPLAIRYRHARNSGMGLITACIFLSLRLLAVIFLRLEGPAWQGLWQRYQPWFYHLLNLQQL